MDVINNLNILLDKVFSIIETEVYHLLDKILIINIKIFELDILNKIIESKGMIYIANSLLFLYICYFLFSKLISIYNGVTSENTYNFIIKLIIITILANSSYFIVYNIIEINGILTKTLEIYFEDIVKEKINFENLKIKVLSIDTIIESDNISLNGILKTAVAFSLTSILINLAIRYVMIIFLILIFPIIIVLYPSELTNELSKNLIKTLILNIVIQNIIKIILVIPIMIKSEEELYQVILLGSMYILQNLNNISKELFARISSYNKRSNIYEV